jgi:hypothetical protein
VRQFRNPAQSTRAIPKFHVHFDSFLYFRAAPRAPQLGMAVGSIRAAAIGRRVAVVESGLISQRVSTVVTSSSSFFTEHVSQCGCRKQGPRTTFPKRELCNNLQNCFHSSSSDYRATVIISGLVTMTRSV